MIDAGGRIKETSIESMARTFQSLTYSYIDYLPNKNKGPRLGVVFTNFSRFKEDADDIMINGLESVSKYDNEDRFEILIQKFKQDLSKKLFQWLNGSQSQHSIEDKVDLILDKDNFYAFKIFPSEKDMQREREEIKRLLDDAKKHGRRYVSNFNEVQNMPNGFHHEDSLKVYS